MKKLLLLPLLAFLAACTDPLADVPVSSGEVYVINSVATFSAGFLRPEKSAVPRFCPVDGAGRVANCRTRDAVPTPGQTTSRNVTLDGTAYAVHRSLLAAPGRYAFVRARVNARTSDFRTRAEFAANTGTTVIDATPNSVIIFPSARVDAQAVLQAMVAGTPPAQALERNAEILSDAENIAIARAAMRSLYGTAADTLTYRVAEAWEIEKLEGGALQLRRKLN